MRIATIFLISFLAITGAATILISIFDVTFLNLNYWNYHGFFFLLFIALFPRLTLLISSVPFGGLFWWLGFIFAPRYLVAILATITHWPTNWFLVICSWLVAFGGESGEKYYVHNKVYTKRTIRHLN